MKLLMRLHLARRLLPLLIIVLVFLLQFFAPSSWQQSLNRLDGLFYDFKISYLPTWPQSVANIQIVDIDEKSLYEVGRMPWSRKHFAQLSQQLTESGAIVIAFDMLFSESQENVARTVAQQWLHNGQITTEEWSELNKTLPQFDYDLQFAKAIQGTDVVLANLFHHQAGLKTGSLANPIASMRAPEGLSDFRAFSGYAAPIDSLARTAVGQGFMNSAEDADGFVRRAALIQQMDNSFYPSLALEVFRVYSLAETLLPSWKMQSGNAFLEGIQIGNMLISTDNQGRINIPFRGAPGHYPYTSAADVLSGKITDKRFANAVVFIGTSATGLADLRSTPLSLNFPGVEIQATVLDALMSPQTIPYQPDWWMGAIALELLVIGLLCLILLPKMGPFGSVITAILLLFAVTSLNLLLWLMLYIDLPIISVFILTAGLSVYFISYGFYSENTHRKRVKAIFDQYVPPAHIDRLLTDPNALNLQGEKKELSVLFSDIRSFTTISESMPAQDLKSWLNQYFSPITKVILEHDGTIDKYVGDMVMAFWGAPLDEPDHANKSIAGAFAMLGAQQQINQHFLQQNLPQAKVGIGINSGEMNVGDMGSDFRRSYTVIGDAVNLGSRLEGLTKFYGVDILVSEFTQQLADKFEFLLIDKVKVKGKVEPVTIYMPLDNQLPADGSVAQINQALQHYFERDFNSAEQQLKSLSADGKYQILIRLYLSRIKFLQNNPPAVDWDGSYTHTSK
ncbi:adenylate/guanylate cyclase domain-containing protein [Alteromonadaceae bacterium BrNp21-10]|nr:adenylate/guanylate cyclase domain-containing protein [Alteromonadaceae bacterium BrNp21-10]